MNDWERRYYDGMLKHSPSRLERWMLRHAIPGAITTSVLLGGGMGALWALKGSRVLALVLGLIWAWVGAFPWISALLTERERQRIRRELEADAAVRSQTHPL